MVPRVPTFRIGCMLSWCNDPDRWGRCGDDEGNGVDGKAWDGGDGMGALEY